jgi:DHA1 family multidrug resistance protein-like MFS transporter
MPLSPSPIVLLLLRAVQGAFAGYVAPAMALVAQQAPAGKQGRTIAGLQVAMAIGTAVGPLVGGELTLLLGRQTLFWFTAAAATTSALVLWLLVDEPAAARPADAPSFVDELLRNSTLLLKSRVFALLLLLLLGLRLGQNMLEPFVALFVQQLGAPGWLRPLCASPESAIERTINLSFTVLAAAQWICTPLWGRAADRFGPLRCLGVLAIALGAIQVATAAVDGIDGFLALRSAAACFMAGSMTLAYAAAGKRIAAAHRTLAFSMVQSCMQFGFAFGPVLGSRIATIGATAEHANLRLPFAVAGALCVLSGGLMLWLRRLPAGRDEHGDQPIGGPEPG